MFKGTTTKGPKSEPQDEAITQLPILSKSLKEAIVIPRWQETCSAPFRIPTRKLFLPYSHGISDFVYLRLVNAQKLQFLTPKSNLCSAPVKFNELRTKKKHAKKLFSKRQTWCNMKNSPPTWPVVSEVSHRSIVRSS